MMSFRRRYMHVHHSSNPPPLPAVGAVVVVGFRVDPNLNLVQREPIDFFESVGGNEGGCGAD